MILSDGIEQSPCSSVLEQFSLIIHQTTGKGDSYFANGPYVGGERSPSYCPSTTKQSINRVTYSCWWIGNRRSKWSVSLGLKDSAQLSQPTGTRFNSGFRPPLKTQTTVSHLQFNEGLQNRIVWGTFFGVYPQYLRTHVRDSTIAPLYKSKQLVTMYNLVFLVGLDCNLVPRVYYKMWDTTKRLVFYIVAQKRLS